MNDKTTIVLLIEDDPADAKVIQEALAAEVDSPFRVEWATLLAAGLERLNKGGVDVVMLDLTLPDAQGIAAFDQVLLAAPDCLILVLSGLTDEEVARQAVQRGAYDYISKSHVDAHWLPRALRYVIARKTALDALEVSEARFRAISDVSPLGILVTDKQGSCNYTNAAYHRISGLTFEQALGTNWKVAIHSDDRERVFSEWQDAARNQKPFQTEFRFLREDQSVVWTRVNAAAMRQDRKLHGYVQTVEDVTERKAEEGLLQEARERLFEEKERAQVTLNSIGDAVLSTDTLGNVTYLNRVAEEMTGWPWQDASGRPLAEVFNVVDGTTRQPARDLAEQAVHQNEIVSLGLHSVLVRRDGFESEIEDSAAPIHDRHGGVVGAVLVFHDVSDSRALALRMSHQAQHDFLTGLPNRLLLTDRLTQAIALSRRHGNKVALLFLDLDHFKPVNDSLGHAIGDKLLQSVAQRLTTCVRTSDTVCRLGGDEFVVLLSEIEQVDAASRCAEKLLQSVAVPHLIAGHEVHITLSIGVSVCPDDGRDAEAMLKNADTAMYHAKKMGRNNCKFFTQT
jgi:diguanylate cyclase (GGDEF)-like protein/PAS domain S-box-containing protein